MYLYVLFPSDSRANFKMKFKQQTNCTADAAKAKLKATALRIIPNLMKIVTPPQNSSDRRRELTKEMKKRKQPVLDIPTHPLRKIKAEDFFKHYQALLTNHEIVCDIVAEADQRTRELIREKREIVDQLVKVQDQNLKLVAALNARV